MTLYTIRKFTLEGNGPRLQILPARYSANRGLFYTHVGWIFYKPVYERMELVDREDLDSDPSESS